MKGNKIQQIISNNWLLLNLSIVLLILFFQFFKHQLFPMLDNANKQTIVEFKWIGFLFMLLGLSGNILIILYYQKLHKITIISFLIASYLLATFGFIYQSDPKLKWEGSDVAWNNYLAAKETKSLGPLYILTTWNSRANPYDKIGYDQQKDSLSAKKLTREFIQKNNLSVVTGNQWVVKDLLVDKNNNRPFMHPPLTPILTGLWFYIFPDNQCSIQLFMISVIIFSILILQRYLQQASSPMLSIVTLQTLLTAPVLILYTNPSAEPITMLLLGVSVLLSISMNRLTFHISFLAGIFAALAFYSKFIVGFFIFYQAVSFLFFYKKLGWNSFIGYIAGNVIVIGLFTMLGYYFWLTYLTGKFVTMVYLLNHPLSMYASLNGLIKIGIPLIFLILFVVFSKQIKLLTTAQLSIFLPMIISIITIIILLFDVGTLDRYLSVYFMALAPFIFIFITKVNLRKIDYLIIPISNFILVASNIYF